MSHIWAFTIPSPSCNNIDFDKYSTPIVGSWFFGKTPLTYLIKKLVLPTLGSPTRITKSEKKEFLIVIC